MSNDEYHPSTSSSDDWLWKTSKVGFTLLVHTTSQNTAYRNQLFLMVFYQNLPIFKKSLTSRKI